MSRVDREGPVHRAILAHLRTQLPDALIVHAANEIGLRGRDVARQIAKAKWNGMVPGFPDLACFLSEGECILFEVKAEGNSTSPAQKEVLARLQQLGFHTAVVRSVQDVDDCLKHWNILPVRLGPGWQSVGSVAARLAEEAARKRSSVSGPDLNIPAITKG